MVRAVIRGNITGGRELVAGKRAHVIIDGKVQGVFYRVETQRAAEAAGLRGWVRIRPDGTVEALLEGDEEDVKAVLEWCRQGPPLARVSRLDVSWEDYVGDLVDFGVKY